MNLLVVLLMDRSYRVWCFFWQILVLFCFYFFLLSFEEWLCLLVLFYIRIIFFVLFDKSLELRDCFEIQKIKRFQIFKQLKLVKFMEVFEDGQNIFCNEIVMSVQG